MSKQESKRQGAQPAATVAARGRSAHSVRGLKLALRRAIGSARDFRKRRELERGHSFSDAELVRHWEWIITSLLRFGGASSGNAVQLFCDGDQMLESLWQSIDQAKQQVWVEMYTFQPDRVGTRTLE